jgi:integrase
MARKRKLDRFVTVFVDRHGKERFRFRRDGFSCYLPHPTDKGYRAAYKAALEGTVERQSRCAPLSVDDLVTRYYRSARFLQVSEARQAAVRMILEPFRAECRKDDVRNFRFEHIEALLSKKAQKRLVGKRMIGGAAAAARLRDELTRLFDYAIKLRWRTDNPAEQAELPAKHNRIGFHGWTEGEIAQFQKHHPLGSKARLAMEIMLWTGLRRSDAAKLGPHHIKGGRIQLRAGKTGKAVDVMAAPDLLAAIKAMPAVGLTTLLVTDYGKPFSDAGFGNWFRDRCNEADLPHCTAHGLRKALARRAAEEGATQQQLKAVGQWSSDRDVATYTAGAEQRGLADAALQMAIRRREREGNNG